MPVLEPYKLSLLIQLELYGDLSRSVLIVGTDTYIDPGHTYFATSL